MWGLRHKVLLVLCSLFIVFAATALPNKTLVNRKGTVKKMSLWEFKLEMSVFDDDDDNELKSIEDRIGNNSDISRDSEGCGQVPGESLTTASAGQLCTSPSLVSTCKAASVLFYYKLLSKFLWF